jgi:predicted transcriptional regulator
MTTVLDEPRYKRVAREVDAAVRWAGYKQKDLAPVLGLSPGQVSQRISGKIEFTISELDKIAEWLGRRYADFQGEITPDNERRRVSASSGWRTRRFRLVCTSGPRGLSSVKAA